MATRRLVTNRASWRSWKGRASLFLAIFLSAGAGADSAVQEVERLKTEYEASSRKLMSLRHEYQNLKERADELSRATIINLVNGRLSPEAGTPVPPLNTTNNTVVYFSPYLGNKITLWSGTQWVVCVFTELSITTSSLAAGNIYDVFAYLSSTVTINLEFSAAWASSSSRTNALTLKDGVLVKASDVSRRYLGTVRMNDASNSYDNNTTRRFIWNYYNRVPRRLRRLDATDTWSYNGSAWRKANNDTNSRVEFVIGINEVLVQASALSISGSAASLSKVSAGVGVNSSTVNSASLNGGAANTSVGVQNWAEYAGYPGIGYYDLSWLETSPDGAVTFWGDNGATNVTSGMLVWLDG